MPSRDRKAEVFEAAVEALKEKILEACDPREMSPEIEGADYLMVIGATYSQLIRIHIELLAEHDEAFAREIIEAHEKDLMQLRSDKGWLQG